MKKELFLGMLTLVLLNSFTHSRMEPVDYVNPFVDTHKSRWFFFSSATCPFGMVSLRPDIWVRGSWEIR